MIESIITIALIGFGVLFSMSLIALRNLELENQRLRKENVELYWQQAKP